MSVGQLPELPRSGGYTKAVLSAQPATQHGAGPSSLVRGKEPRLHVTLWGGLTGAVGYGRICSQAGAGDLQVSVVPAMVGAVIFSGEVHGSSGAFGGLRSTWLEWNCNSIRPHPSLLLHDSPSRRSLKRGNVGCRGPSREGFLSRIFVLCDDRSFWGMRRHTIDLTLALGAGRRRRVCGERSHRWRIDRASPIHWPSHRAARCQALDPFRRKTRLVLYREWSGPRILPP